MNAALITTDAEAVEMLTGQITTACSIGLHGRRRRRSFDTAIRAGRRNRRRLNLVLCQCMEWSRSEGCGAADGPLAGTYEGVRASVSSYIAATLSVWLLSIVAGWLIDLAVEAFVTWWLSSQSQAFRAALASERQA